MDLGSMNRSRMEVKGTREAMTVQDWAAQRCTISYRAPELFNVESHCVIDDRTDIWVTHTSVLRTSDITCLVFGRWKLSVL